MKKSLPIILVLFSLLSCNGREQISDSITVVNGTQYNLSCSAINISIKLDVSSDKWDYSCGADWIAESSRSRSTLSLFVSKNDSYESRETEILFYARTGDPEPQASVTIIQGAQELVPELVLSREKVEFPCGESGTDISVSTTYSDWTWEMEACDWLSVSADGSSLILKALANPVDDERTASLIVYASASGKELSRKVSVIQAPADIEYPAEDLSSGGTANCYLVSHRGEYSFDASVRGNGRQSEGLELPEALTPVSVKLVWQSAPGMVESLSLDGTRVRFTLSRVRGNALLAVCDAVGEIIWSWHIWFPKQMPNPMATGSSLEIMDMNLGAMSSERSLDAYGLLYQWGRKDPFPGSPLASGGSVNTVNVPVYDMDGKEVKIRASEMYSNKDNTLAFSIAHPETCLSRGKTGSNDWLLPEESNSAFWGNPKGAECGSDGKYLNNGSKSFYDPCPPGWRVAPPVVFADFTASGQYAWVNLDSNGNAAYGADGNLSVSYFFGEDRFNVCDIDGDGKITMNDWYNGWVFKLAGGSSYFPAAARYDGTYAMLMGSMVGQWGSVWTNAASKETESAPSYTSVALAYGICDYNKKTQITISPNGNGARADAYSVRCIKE